LVTELIILVTTLLVSTLKEFIMLINPEILVVDDDPQHLDIAMKKLGNVGINAIGILDGTQALEAIREFPSLWLILLDWNMSPMGAKIFLQTLEREGWLTMRGESLSIYIVSGDCGKARQEATKANLAGYIQGFLDKPADFKMISGLISANTHKV
jgi:CheY-like chemotaxis protein